MPSNAAERIWFGASITADRFMSKPTQRFSVFRIILILSCALHALAGSSSDKFIGRWERPGGGSPMVFSQDGSCEVSLGAAKNGKWTMIKGTYTISDAGKLTLKAKGEGVYLSKSYFFEGDKLTDGTVFFNEGRRYWSKVGGIGSKPIKKP